MTRELTGNCHSSLITRLMSLSIHVAGVVALSMANGQVITRSDPNSNASKSTVRQCIGRVVTDYVYVTKFFGNPARKPSQVADPVSIVHRPATRGGYISHEIAAPSSSWPVLWGRSRDNTPLNRRRWRHQISKGTPPS